jgi:AcrR family transcriptional regulator
MTAKTAPAPRSSRKRDMIIDKAAHVLNSQGLGNTRLIDVAEQVGLTRAALYYYFRDMEALAIACYERTIGDIRESARKAQAVDGSGRAKLECYFRTMLSPDVLDRIVLVEASALTGPRTEGLVASLDEAVDELIKLIAMLIDEGEFAQVALPLVAAAIMGAVGQCALDYQAGHRHGADRWAENLFHLFYRGLAARRDFNLSEPPPALPSASNLEIGFDREALARMKRETLLRKATEMFNMQGVDAVSLDDLVGELSVSKGVFYHYLDSKEELLLACYERSLNLADRITQHIEEMKIPAIEKVAEYIRQVIIQHYGPDGPFVVFYGTHALNDTHRTAIFRRLRYREARIHRWLAEAKANGDLDFADLDLAHQAIDGMLRWVPKWEIPEGDDARYARAGSKLARLVLFGFGR